MRTAIRLLPLPLCIAASLAAQVAHAADERPIDYRLCPVQDAIPAFADAPAPVGTTETREQQPTDIEGDTFDGVDGQTLTYDGNVALSRGDQFLGADNLRFNQETSTYIAEGSVRYQDSGMRLVAKSAEGDQTADTHRIQDVEYQLIQRRGNGGADRIEMKGAQGALYGSTYSTCPPDDRFWELKAQRIDVDTDKGFGTARNAVLRVGKIPVLWVPWFSFPIDDQRRTGLLYPSIASSGRNGFDWRQPIYLNLAPNYDATLEPRFMSKRGLLLGGEFRYLTESGAGTFDFEYLPSDDLATRERWMEEGSPYDPANFRKENRGLFQYRGYQNIDSHWQGRANLNWISDPRYLEDFSNSLSGITSFAISSDIGVYGRGRFWEAGLMADKWQLSDWTLSDANLPYDRLPRAYVSWEQPLQHWLVAGIDAEATRFQHADAGKFGGSRIDVKPYISLPLEGASWFVRPTLAYRYTGYQLEDGLAAQLAAGNGSTEADSSPSRSMPIGTLDAGLYFDRSTLFRGDDYLHTLEPRLFYLNSPYRDQTGLPLFDTAPLTFSWGQLFRDNRFSGADRQADANQLTLALTTRLIRESDGREKLSASIGQIKYFDDSEVVTTPCISDNNPVGCEFPLERGKSAWIAETTYAINDRWTASAGYQWDPKVGKQDLASFRTRYLIGDDGIVNLSYRNRRNLLEQVDFSFLYPITPAWSVVGRYYYSLRDRALLEGVAGVQWDSCCLAVRLVGRRYLRDRLGELNSAIQLEIELKGLGSAGPDTESRLRRAILGYYREDLYLVPPPPSVRSGAVAPSNDTTP